MDHRIRLLSFAPGRIATLLPHSKTTHAGDEPRATRRPEWSCSQVEFSAPAHELIEDCSFTCSGFAYHENTSCGFAGERFGQARNRIFHFVSAREFLFREVVSGLFKRRRFLLFRLAEAGCHLFRRANRCHRTNSHHAQCARAFQHYQFF